MEKNKAKTTGVVRDRGHGGSPYNAGDPELRVRKEASLGSRKGRTSQAKKGLDLFKDLDYLVNNGKPLKNL